MTDREVVDEFVANLRRLGHRDLVISGRPDEGNRTSQDVDAIAGPFAIEHTSVDTVPHQRRNSSHFLQVFGALEAEFHDKLPFYLGITVDYESVAVGQNWPSVRAALTDSVAKGAPRLPDGSHVVRDVAGVPFPLHVRKSCSRRPGLFVSRFAPADTTLAERVKGLLDRKAKKLALYKGRGFSTVLLVESSDIALMNEAAMLSAIREAYPSGLIAGVDQVWFADTSIVGRPEFLDFTPDLLNGRGDR